MRIEQQIIRDMPKVELHLHIEGTFEPELVFKIAERNGLEVKAGDRVFTSPEELREAYKFDNLQEFLDVYYAGMNVLQTYQDYYDLTMAYFERAAQDNIVHAEIMFDPQMHMERGVALKDVIEGITNAREDAEKRFSIISGLIYSFVRHLSEAEATKAWTDAAPYLDKIIGVGLDSSEEGNPPEKFVNLYHRIRQEHPHLLRTAHAGEEGDASYVQGAYSEDGLDVHRIDHGNKCLEDPLLVKSLASDAIPLTVCPLSNIALKNVESLEEHPLLEMLDKNLMVTINSDDPAYFGGYLTDNLLAVHGQMPGVFLHDIVLMQEFAIEAAWVSEQRKDALYENLKRFMVGVESDPSFVLDGPV